MAKNIIILNGSPRLKGNTSALTAEFKKGAEESGNKVTEFHLPRMKINGCLGCWHGGKALKHPSHRKTIWIRSILFTGRRMWLFWHLRYIIGLYPAF